MSFNRGGFRGGGEGNRPSFGFGSTGRSFGGGYGRNDGFNQNPNRNENAFSGNGLAQEFSEMGFGGGNAERQNDPAAGNESQGSFNRSGSDRSFRGRNNKFSNSGESRGYSHNRRGRDNFESRGGGSVVNHYGGRGRGHNGGDAGWRQQDRRDFSRPWIRESGPGFGADAGTQFFNEPRMERRVTSVEMHTETSFVSKESNRTEMLKSDFHQDTALEAVQNVQLGGFKELDTRISEHSRTTSACVVSSQDSARPELNSTNGFGYGTSDGAKDATLHRKAPLQRENSQSSAVSSLDAVDVSFIEESSEVLSSTSCRSSHTSSRLGFSVSVDSQSDVDQGSVSSQPIDSDLDRLSVSSLECGVDLPGGRDVENMRMAHKNRSVLVAPKKAPALRHDKKIERLQANIFTLQVSHKIVYRYDVCIRLKRAAGMKDVELTKGAKDDAATTERHELCMMALRRALEMYRILHDGNAVAHDGSAIMFASENLEETLKPHGSILSLTLSDLPAGVRSYIRSADVEGLEIELAPCRESAAQFDIADFESAQNNRDMAHLDRSWKQFHEMLTNQHAIADGRFTLFGAGKLFSRDAPRRAVGYGHELITGGDKGIKFIEGRQPGPSRAVAALVLDAKVGQFFKSQSLMWSIGELLKDLRHDRLLQTCRFPFEYSEDDGRVRMNAVWCEVNKYIKGLRLNYVNSASTTNSTFVAVGISRQPIGALTEMGVDGTQRSVLDKFTEHNTGFIPEWPAVVFRSFGEDRKLREIHYPMELLVVAPHQRVSLQKQIAPPTSAVKPDVRYRQISDIMNALNLDSHGSRNAYLQAFGISVADRPYELEAIRRKTPTVVYKSNACAATDAYKANWRMDRNNQYICAGTADLIVFAYTCDVRIARDAMSAMQRMLATRGTVVERWELAAVDKRNWTTALSQLFLKVKAESSPKKCIVFVDDRDTKSHGWLKLLERRDLIVTQQLTTELAMKLFKQPNSCSNVVNKLNCKLTGLNHAVVPDEYGLNHWLSTGRTLVIGYDVAHPGKADRDEVLNKRPPQSPSVVGVSFNGGPHAESFIGDFHYQEPRMEQVSAEVLNVRMKWMLKLFCKNRRNWPESIFVVRDGISEGQYRMAIDYELSALREACEEYGNLNGRPDWAPKFLLVVVTKRHGIRTFKAGRNGVENTLPCTVIDTDIVRNDMTEFILQPHRVIQGTGKSPTYQVLVDDLDLSSDEIQATMLALAFNHQIVESPISLPEPVYQADEWAKRGNEMWKTFGEKYNFPLCSHRGQYCSPPIDFDAMTKRLGYWNTILEESRVNA